MIASLAAAAMAGGLTLSGASPAQAAPDDVSLPPITGTTGTIVVTKYTDPPSGGHDNGLPNPAPGESTLDDVGFTVCKVVGYTTFDGELQAFGDLVPNQYDWWQMAASWAADSQAHPEGAAGRVALGACTTEVLTGAAGTPGQAVFAGLDIGLYMVQESTPLPSYMPVDPFLVTLPMADPTTPRPEGSSGWIERRTEDPADPGSGEYIAWTYPKNAEVTVTKTANTSGTTSAGSQIEYTIATQKPTMAPGTMLTSFVITDTLNYGQDPTLYAKGPRLTFASADMTGPWTITLGETSFSGALGTCEADPLSEGYGTVPFMVGYAADPAYPAYSAYSVAATYTACPGGALLAALNTAAVGAQVEVVVTATLRPVVTTTATGMVHDGHVQLVNRAGAQWNAAGGYGTAISHVGAVLIHKQDSQTHAMLRDAHFAIYAVDPTTGTCSDPEIRTEDGCVKAELIWTPAQPIQAVTMAGAVTDDFVTDATGTVPIMGLAYGPDNTECTVDGGYRHGRYYWVVETQAPAGYVASSNATQVCVAGPYDGVDSSYDDYFISNTPRNAGFPLPYTGNFEDDLPMWLGVFVIVCGFTAYTLRTKKRAKTQTA